MEEFTKEKFRAALNQSFTLEAGAGQRLELQLVSVNDLGTVPPRQQDFKRAPFSALFRGPRSPWARQHIYLLENQLMGKLEIFLVPLGPDQEGMIYEAVFS